MITNFLFNERRHAAQIVERFEAQFHEDVHSLRNVQFWIGETNIG
jgi:hypothetical protein